MNALVSVETFRFGLLGSNALLSIFHLFGHRRVDCRVPFCLLIILRLFHSPRSYPI